MTKYLEFRNISTILTTIFLTIFGLLLGYLTSKGIDLPITAETLTSLTLGIIFAIFGYYNAKNHNTFFDKDEDVIYIPIDELDKHQIDAINNFIETAIQTNLKHEEKRLDDIDPASEYEKIGDEDVS